MKIKGIVKHKLAVASGTSNSGSEWSKQTLVVETTNGEYSDDIAVDFFGDKLDLITDLKQGQEVEVSLNLKSREYNGKWYTNVNGWKIEAGASAEAQPEAKKEVVTDDLPF